MQRASSGRLCSTCLNDRLLAFVLLGSSFGIVRLYCYGKMMFMIPLPAHMVLIRKLKR